MKRVLEEARNGLAEIQGQKGKPVYLTIIELASETVNYKPIKSSQKREKPSPRGKGVFSWFKKSMIMKASPHQQAKIFMNSREGWF